MVCFNTTICCDTKGKHWKEGGGTDMLATYNTYMI